MSVISLLLAPHSIALDDLSLVVYRRSKALGTKGNLTEALSINVTVLSNSPPNTTF